MLRMSERWYYGLKSQPATPEVMSSRVAREIGRLVVGGQVRPGEMVEEEGALARRYGVSRTVVRDAVKLLVGKGLLEVRRGIGTRVKPRSDWGLLDDDVLLGDVDLDAHEVAH